MAFGTNLPNMVHTDPWGASASSSSETLQSSRTGSPSPGVCTGSEGWGPPFGCHTAQRKPRKILGCVPFEYATFSRAGSISPGIPGSSGIPGSPSRAMLRHDIAPVFGIHGVFFGYTTDIDSSSYGDYFPAWHPINPSISRCASFGASGVKHSALLSLCPYSSSASPIFPYDSWSKLHMRG